MTIRCALYFAIAAGSAAFAYWMSTRDQVCHPIQPPSGCIQSLHSACDNSCHESMAPDDFPEKWRMP